MTPDSAPSAALGTQSMSAREELGKVPAVTLGFWLIKILATTLGETGGDAVTMSMDLGYLIGTLIFAGIFIIAIGFQIATRRFHPLLFWAVIIATTTVGTTLADLLDRSVGLGYLGGTSILLVLLLTVLALWRLLLGSVSISSITSRPAEGFYWGTILVSQTLGTALGDWMADDDGGAGLGYERSALVFSTALVLVGAGMWWRSIPRSALFWAAFILTRPLGATLGDLLDKPRDHGGMELSRYTASGVLVVVIIALVLLLPQRAERLRHRTLAAPQPQS